VVRGRWIIPLLLLSLGAGAAASGEGYRFSREVQVPQAGWVRMPLDGRVIAQAQPGERWNLIGPDGEAVPFKALSPHRGFLDARTLTIDEDPDGWRILFDLGPTPVRHRRLQIDLMRQTSAAGCRVEGSHDLENWIFLGEGTLFRLGAGERLHGSALDYSETDLRYLRLWWPKEAGFPEFRGVGVQSLPGPPGDPLTVAVDLRREVNSGSGTGYRLHLPGPGLEIRSLILGGLDVGGEQIAYRLYQAEWRRWEVLAEGRLKAGKQAEIAIGGNTLDRSQLRLELYSADEGDLHIEEAILEVLATWLLFHAEQPGMYTLVYGGEPAAKCRALANDLEIGPLVEIRPDEEEESLPFPQIPERLVSPVAAEDPGERVREWRVDVRDAAKGDVVRLELPDDVRSAVGSSISQLRLQAEGNEIPYLITTPEEPQAAIVLEGLSPAPVSGERHHRISLNDARLSPLLSQVEILAGEEQFERPARLLFPLPARPGVETRPVEIVAQWQCGASDGIKCRAAIGQIPARSTGEMQILIEPEGGSTGDSFTLRGWTARPSLVFVHPGSNDLALVWSRDGQSRVREYPLEKHAATLLAMPWSEAGLDTAEARRQRSRRDNLSKGAMIAMLVLGAIALLWILARNLRN
jgi:hypothetical protein